MRSTPGARLLFGLAALLGCANPAHNPKSTPTPRSYAQNLLGALSGAAVEKTRGDMLAIATAIGSYGAQTGEAPAAADIDALERQLAPTYIRRLPRTDAWSRPFQWSRTASGWSLIAPGPDALAGSDDDIVLSDRGFTQLPKGYVPAFSDR